MKIQDTIKGLINDALTEVGVDIGDTQFVLEHPADLEHGDFACNVAMILAKMRGENPRELAVVIRVALPEHEYMAKTEVAGPGFINFYLSKKFFADSLKEVLSSGEKWGSGEMLAGKKVMVEYTDPNPFKEIHIGHLVPNSIGVALARTAAASGAEVREVTFQGDVGMHVAKAVYGMQKLGLNVENGFTAADLGKAYALGATAFEQDEVAKPEITKLNKRIFNIYTGEEVELAELYKKGKDVSIKYFEEVYKLLGSNFEHYFFESETGKVGERLVRENIEKVFEESNGAVVFKGEEHGLHTRVFINAQGLPTYEAKDLGLVQSKHEWWPHDTSVTVTGNEIAEYFKVVKKAAELVLPEHADKMMGVMNGMLTLKNGKMSSRTGDVIRVLDLIDDVKRVVRERMQDADDESVMKVAVGAIKYSILKSGTNKNIVFDFNTSLSLDGDSGPYLQYTYARCRSVLRNAGTWKRFMLRMQAPKHRLVAGEVEKLLYRFPEVVERAASEYEPHYIASYINELASAFNSFYAKEKILDGSETESYKLALTNAVAQTLQNGLNLLGVEVLERM